MAIHPVAVKMLQSGPKWQIEWRRRQQSCSSSSAKEETLNYCSDKTVTRPVSRSPLLEPDIHYFTSHSALWQSGVHSWLCWLFAPSIIMWTGIPLCCSSSSCNLSCSPQVDYLVGVCWLDEGRRCHDTNLSTLGQVRADKIRCLRWIWRITMLRTDKESRCIDINPKSVWSVLFNKQVKRFNLDHWL